MSEVLVVGAGLSGLAAAWYLTEAGVKVHVIEASAAPGGLIHTRTAPEGLIESAANALVRSARSEQLFDALRIETARIRPDCRRRYIFRNGRATRWPLSVRETAGAAARLARAWTRRQMRPGADESVACWAERVAGPAAARFLIDPMARGIYAAPATSLSAQAIGRARARAGKRGGLAAPRLGMGDLPARLHDALAKRGATFEWRRHVATLDPRVPTVIATPARAASRLLASDAPAFAAAAARIRSTSLLTVTAFFDRRPDDLPGFGVLFPRGEHVTALGVLFNTDIFEDRGTLRSETWMYEDLSVERHLAEVLLSDRQRLTGRPARLVAAYPTAQADAIPVYDEAVLEAGALVDQLPPWLAVCGNYLGRLGLAKLLDVAAEAATRIAKPRTS